MKKIVAILAFMSFSVAAVAVQDVELKETPPLKPLNWCKGEDGVSHEQIEECGPGQTVGTSMSTNEPVAAEPIPVAEAKTDNAAESNHGSVEVPTDTRMPYWQRIAIRIVLVLGIGALFRFIKGRI
jgi:hypothetical protein